MTLMGVGQSFAQYSTDDLVSAGWEAVNGTTVTLTDLDNYYYLLVDGTETNKSLTYSGVGTDARPVYQLLYDPTISVGQVWKLEASNDKFKLKNYANDWYYCSNSWGWNSYMGTNESYTEHEFVLNDGKYYLHVKDEGGTTRALGAWGDYNLSGNGQGYAGTAGNKDVGGSNDRGFYIYRIARADFTPAPKPSAQYAAAGWVEVTAIEDWGVAGRKYVFLDYSETGFETEMVMTATENGLPQYQRSNMSKAQWWATEAKSDGYAFKSVQYDTYSNYTAPWGGNMSADVPGNYFKVSLANGKWALKNTSDNGNWLGRWGDSDNGKNGKNDPFAGEQLAANKGIGNGRRLYNVYAMPTAIDAAEALPANGDMAADQWYFFDIEIAGDTYAATATTLADIECIAYSTGNAVELKTTDNSLAATRYYVKSSSANNLKVAATSYSYNISAAVADPADGSIIKPGQTITVSFNALTDDSSATPTVDFSGVTFGGNALAVTPDGTGFTFTVPAGITAATEYELSIPAGAVQYTGEASSEDATFTYSTPVIFDGIYYMRNTDPNYEDKYISRQGAWATRAGLDDFGLAVNLTLNDGKYTIQFFDSEQYLYGGGGECWTDGGAGSANKFDIEKVSGGYKFKYTDTNKYLYIWDGDGKIYKDGEEGNNVSGTTNVWALETPSEYTASCYARNAQKQVVAAATAAGLTGITTGAQLEAAFTNSLEITIPTIERQSQRDKHAANDVNGTHYTFFEETVTGLTDGVYKLSFKGMQRAASYSRVDAAEGARGVIYAYANDAKTQLVSAMEEGAADAYADSDYESTRTGLHYPNSSTSTYAAFNAGLYDNEIYVYVTGGTLNFGIKTSSRCPNNSESWAVFGDFTLTYFSNSYSYLIGDAETDPASGSITQAGQTITVNFSATTDDTSATPTVDFSGVTFDGNAAAVVTNGTGFTFTVPNDVTANTIYKLIIPEGAVQYAGEASSAATTLTYGTAVNDGIYLLYNAATDKYLAPSGNDIYVTNTGEPISWVVNNDGNSPIKFIETNKYVNGRWWANTGDDARAFALVVSEEPGLEGFKLKKTNPEDNNNGEYYEYLYISGERVATNGRYQDKENPDNFNDWAYAVWQFVPVTDITISESTDYAPTETWANVTLARTIKAGTWNTFVVPFDITNDELKAAFGDEVAVAEFSDSGASADAVTVHFNLMETPAITANTPVLLKGNDGSGFNFDNKLIKTGEAKVAGTYVDFVGTYDADTIADGNYFISANKLYKSTGNTTIHGTHAYIDAKNVTAGIKFFIGDIETSISDINGMAAEDGVIYNLAGQRVNKAQKGIFIAKGKKVIK